jgi:glycosyl transferase family 25
MIPTVLCISLADQTQRRAFMAEQFERLGLRHRFLDAIRVDVATHGWPAAYDRTRRLAYAGQDLKPGEIGCYLSHRAAWQGLLASPEPVVLVLEDDVQLVPDFEATVGALCDGPADWDFVRLFGVFARPVQRLRGVHGEHQLVDYLVQPRGMQGYLLTRRGAEALLRHTESIVHAIDDAIDREWEHSAVMRGIEPPVLAHMDFATTITGRYCAEVSFAKKLWRECVRVDTNARKWLLSTRKRLHYLFRRGSAAG